MGQRQPRAEVDPAALPPGTAVGPWRVRGWLGRGSYGTVYRVEREGKERAGAFALKLALRAQDERFEREAALLGRIEHPSVPRLHWRGVWRHAAGGFPYLVMEWVEGVALYEWAARRNPSSRQVLGLLGQVARALEATHGAGGVHRDVKGDNVLVRPADGRAFLTDFGAGDLRGAATLTQVLLPPGTSAYRSPEAWAFGHLFSRHPTARYEASACDDLFALGVMAYRLVTDEHPPPTDPKEEGGEVWAPGGGGPRRARALNERVCAELDGLIARLLSVAPVERFQGSARRAAQALEEAAASAGAEADRQLFAWETQPASEWAREEVLSSKLRGHRLRRREAAEARLAHEQDALAAAGGQGSEAEEPPEEVTATARDDLSALLALVGLLLVLAAIGALSMGGAGRGEQGAEQQPLAVSQAEPELDRADGGSRGLAEEFMVAQVPTQAEPSGWNAIGIPMPDAPLKGQRRAPHCSPPHEQAINGGCWIEVARAKPPCGNHGYEWKDGCYYPVFDMPRQPTSGEP